MKALKTLLIMALTMIVLSVSVSATVVLDSVAQTENEGTAISTVLPEASGIVGTATYALTSLPSGANFDANTRTFTWTPDYNGAVNSPYTMTYTVTDDADPTNPVSVNYVLTVEDYNPLTITEDVLLGGSTQHRSNPDADDDDYINAYASRDVTITNNGDLPVTVTLTHNQDDDYDFVYDVTLNDDTPVVGVVVPAQNSISFELEAYVPEDLPSFFPRRADFDDRRNLLGELTLVSSTTGVDTITTNFYLEAENMLDFDELDVEAGSEDESITNDDEELDNIRPNDEVIVTAEVENEYEEDDNEDIEIEDIEMVVEINDGEFDVDEDVSFDDLDAEEVSDKESIDFVLDYEDVDEDSYSLYITLTGKTEHGAVMGKKFEVILNVEMEDDDIALDNVELEPSNAFCKASTTLSFDLINIGEDDQDEVAYKIEAPALDLFISKYNIEIDEDDEDDFRVDIPLDGIKTGDYYIEVTAYVDRNEPTDSKSVELHVEGCVEEEEEEEIVPESGMDDVTGGATAQPPVTIIPELESFNEFQGTSVYVILLGGLVVVLTIVLILLLVKFVF